MFPSKRIAGRSLGALALVAASLTAITAPAAQAAPSHLQAGAAITAPVVPAAVSAPYQERHRTAQLLAAGPSYWIVRPGQSLSSIAQAAYHNAGAWPVLWKANHIRWADIIPAGQRLVIPPLPAVIPAPPTELAPGHASAAHARPAADGRVWGITYGYPYRCGDGDGDGWDLPCSKLFHSAPVLVSHSAPAPVSVSGYGTLSLGQLESLWVSAGGPGWAEVSAANVAECESGGRLNAYNPSGASGLWQILGSVVPGNLFNAFVNALNAVAKFRASGDTWAQWVCQP